MAFRSRLTTRIARKAERGTRERGTTVRQRKEEKRLFFPKSKKKNCLFFPSQGPAAKRPPPTYRYAVRETETAPHGDYRLCAPYPAHPGRDMRRLWRGAPDGARLGAAGRAHRRGGAGAADPRYSAEAARLQHWRVAAYPPTHATTATPEKPVNPSPDVRQTCARYAPDDLPENPVLGSG